MEAWIEVNIDQGKSANAGLLTDVVDDLVHNEFRDDLEAWHYLWEPEGLRFRIRWSDSARASELNDALRRSLDRALEAGLVRTWYEGAHGRPGEIYIGEADFYGAEVWPSIQKDWMNGSELALLLIKLEGPGHLSRDRDFHWSRHVHLFSNQLLTTLDAEIGHCLTQAFGYMDKLKAEGVPLRREVIEQMIQRLKGFLEDEPAA